MALSSVAARAGLYVAALIITLTNAQTAAVTVSCAAANTPYVPFFQSCGYTPAEYALRQDEIENMVWIGSTPSRGVAQVRIHFLLDLLNVVGFLPSATTPSGFEIAYDWSQLDSAMDWLVNNTLSPGFELMGSPPGFPQLPQSTYGPSSGNGHIEANTTIAMLRTMSGDIVMHYAGRYGVQEVATWNWETWNEPACGWNWPTGANFTPAVMAGYEGMWDAFAAGIEDAETALRTTFKFGGPAACKGIDSPHMQWAVQHYSNGTNALTGAPARLDFISSHYKGGGTAAGTVEGAQGLFAWLRSTYPSNPRNLWSIPFYNDEADPVVGWAIPLDWRGDSRYSAMQAKEVNQHLLAIQDATVAVANPIGLISFDAAMMNAEGYTGWSQRTLLARFNNGSGMPGSPFGFVRKPGLLFYIAMSKLGRLPAGAMRCTMTGDRLATNSTVLQVPFGGIATIIPSARDGVNPDQLSVMLYSSNDTSNATGPSDILNVNLSLQGTPFPDGATVRGVHWRLDDTADPSAVWVQQGSPVTPSPAQLQALWASGKLVMLSNAEFTVAAGGTVLIPSFDLPLPALSVWHFAAQPTSSPPTPSGVRAFVKNPSLSLLDSTAQREVLVRWDCASPRNSTNAAPVVSDVALTYLVQSSSGGANGPWITVWGDSTLPGQFDDFGCAAIYAASAGTAAWLQVAAVDYWGSQSEWSGPVQSMGWPYAPGQFD